MKGGRELIHVSLELDGLAAFPGQYPGVRRNQLALCLHELLGTRLFNREKDGSGVALTRLSGPVSTPATRTSTPSCPSVIWSRMPPTELATTGRDFHIASEIADDQVVAGRLYMEEVERGGAKIDQAVEDLPGRRPRPRPRQP
jgi:hypothetical protein